MCIKVSKKCPQSPLLPAEAQIGGAGGGSQRWSMTGESVSSETGSPPASSPQASPGDNPAVQEVPPMTLAEAMNKFCREMDEFRSRLARAGCGDTPLGKDTRAVVQPPGLVRGGA